ncbi:MAG TPA: 2Fe-2S iron-sulfur cluster-binding protein [Acetobacteraceae bacterium]|jgi:carbon-monoxide dehydrogenase small subunit|nr:2Fe-2S iron-sulfur cluster-binding protein [Acetobacteraceae bacterium]
MSRVTLTVNGISVTAEAEPRTHLADFLREDRLLTGTHLGCEHGVCGACTLLIDGAPARSCIAYAVACDGADVRTIEGLEDDPAIVRLRAAFTAEHALQCGYCTPGMLVTARDIVHRLPDADEARIRLELAGNLCRCTGYAGIVRAIGRVLAEGAPLGVAAPAPLPALSVMPTPLPASAMTVPRGTEVIQALRIGLPLPTVWAAIRDPALVAACLPGARLVSVVGDRLSGEVCATLGPIETLFTGEGTMVFDEADWRAEISGEGRDARTGTRLSARAVLRLRELDTNATTATLSIDYTLRGPLAQFARGAVVREFAAEIAAIVARNLEVRLRGATPDAPRRLSTGSLMLRVIWRRLRAVLGLR